MDYHLQILGEGIYIVLYGSEGMMEAANQYCDTKDALELSEYAEWIGRHGLRARLCIRPEVKRIFFRRRVDKAVRESNDLLQRYGALIPECEIDQREIEYTLLHRYDDTEEGQDYHMDIRWDPEAAVWIAESDDVPGLVLEDDSLERLKERFKVAVPEILGLNDATKDDK